MIPKILTHAQAAAIYRAMTELSALGMRLDADNGDIRVFENLAGHVRVAQYDTEIYASKETFAAAYNLAPSVKTPPQQSLPNCLADATQNGG